MLGLGSLDGFIGLRSGASLHAEIESWKKKKKTFNLNYHSIKNNEKKKKKTIKVVKKFYEWRGDNCTNVN